MSAPSCKGTRGKPWYRGYGTTQEQRTWLYGQPPGVVQTAMIASSMQSEPFAFNLQSVEVYIKLDMGIIAVLVCGFKPRFCHCIFCTNMVQNGIISR